MCLKAFFVLLFASLCCVGADLSLSTQYHAWSEETNYLAQTALIGTPLTSWLNGTFGARLAENKSDLAQFDYSAELALPFLSIFTFRARLSQMNFLSDSTCRSDLLFLLEVGGSPFHGFSLYGDFGWYERFVSIDKALILPVLIHNSYREHDMAARVGFRADLMHSLTLQGEIATYEEIEVYNLNNPYAGLRLLYRPANADWRLYLESRYQILLGFGRLDDFMMGVGAAFSI